jgi:hypothetical protein
MDTFLNVVAIAGLVVGLLLILAFALGRWR